jgi:hypothetical protein
LKIVFAYHNKEFYGLMGLFINGGTDVRQ